MSSKTTTRFGEAYTIDGTYNEFIESSSSDNMPTPPAKMKKSFVPSTKKEDGCDYNYAISPPSFDSRCRTTCTLHSPFRIERPWSDLVNSTVVGSKNLHHLFAQEYNGTVPDGSYAGFPKLFSDSLFADVRLSVGPDAIEVGAHQAILAEKSDYFHEYFKNSVAVCPCSSKVYMSTFNSNVLKNILQFIYTGQIKHSEHPAQIAELYHESIYLGVKPFTDHIIQYIKRMIKEGHGLNNEVSMEYVITLIRGLKFREQLSRVDDVNEILGLVVEDSRFDAWLDQNEFLKLLEDHPEVSSVMLCRYSKIKHQKVEQSSLKISELAITSGKQVIDANSVNKKLDKIQEMLETHMGRSEILEDIDSDDEYVSEVEIRR